MKARDNFQNDKSKSFNAGSTCKECRREIIRNKRKDPEYRKLEKERKHKYDITHRKELREYAREYRKNHPLYVKNIYSKKRERYIQYNQERLANMQQQYGFDMKKFHAKALNYVKKHKLIPWWCSLCGDSCYIELHHPSYVWFDKRKEVVFVCKKCHKLIHSWELECPEPLDLVQLNARMPTILFDKDLEKCKS